MSTPIALPAAAPGRAAVPGSSAPQGGTAGGDTFGALVARLLGQASSGPGDPAAQQPGTEGNLDAQTDGDGDVLVAEGAVVPSLATVATAPLTAWSLATAAAGAGTGQPQGPVATATTPTPDTPADAAPTGPSTTATGAAAPAPPAVPTTAGTAAATAPTTGAPTTGAPSTGETVPATSAVTAEPTDGQGSGTVGTGAATGPGMTGHATTEAAGPGREAGAPRDAVPASGTHAPTDQAASDPARPAERAATGAAVRSAEPASPAPAAPAASTPSVTGGAAPAASPTAAPADAPPGPARVTGQVFPEVTRLAQTTTAGGTQRITLQLQPEQLGEVRVVLVARPGQALQVDLVAGPEARRALLDGSIELRRLLETVGAGEARVVVREAGSSSHTGTSTGWGGAERQLAQQGQPDHHGRQEQADPFSPTAGDGGQGQEQGSRTSAADTATDGEPTRVTRPGDPTEPTNRPVTGARSAAVDVTV